MTLEMFSGILIVISILFVLTLPFNFLFFRFLRELIKLLKELKTDYKRIAAEVEGVKFIINSDAHTPDRIGDFRSGLERAERAGGFFQERGQAAGSPADRGADQL